MQTLEPKPYYATTLPTTNEQDLDRRVNRALERCASCIYSLSNEPTLACFCISENLVKTGVQLTDKRDEMRKLDKKLSGALIDIEFSIDSIKMMKNSDQHFRSAQDLIKNAIFCKQQIDYKRKFQQQMEKDHSVEDFRRLTIATRESKRNAFQRFSTSFEASIEGLASSASVEFKDALKNISQFTTSNLSGQSSQSNQSKKLSQPSTSQSSVQSNDQPTSSKVLNAIIKEEEESSREDKR